jgi:hypothetical protein
LNFSRTNTGRANFYALDRTIFGADASRLQVGPENAFSNFHELEADAAFFLGKTAVCDMATGDATFAAGETFFSHDNNSLNVI